nr:YitT family protein [Oscillospiraceae bacterium]
MTLDWKRDLKRVLAILFAALLLAVSIKTFVRAADLFPGGVTGLTVLIQRLCEKFLGFI